MLDVTRITYNNETNIIASQYNKFGQSLVSTLKSASPTIPSILFILNLIIEINIVRVVKKET